MFETCDYEIVDGDIVGIWAGFVDGKEHDHVRLCWWWTLGHNLAVGGALHRAMLNGMDGGYAMRLREEERRS